MVRMTDSSTHAKIWSFHNYQSHLHAANGPIGTGKCEMTAAHAMKRNTSPQAVANQLCAHKYTPRKRNPPQDTKLRQITARRVG